MMLLDEAPVNFTTPSSASCAIRDALPPSLDLNFPEGEGFVPLPPHVSLSEMIARSRQLRAWFPQGIRTEQERWLAKSTEPFQL